MKHLVMFIACMALVFSFVGCDHEKKDTDTRSCWTTVDDIKTFTPVKFHPHLPWKVLSKADIAFIKSALDSGSSHTEYAQGQFRTVCAESAWTMTGYTAAGPHTPGFFVCEFGGILVNITKPVTLELQTKHCPKPTPRALWHPYTREEVEEIENYDPNNPDHWGYWTYTEVECPSHEV